MSQSQNTIQQSMRCFISGRVQGVFFRDGARQMANQLNITGYAKNLEDGRVEVYITGEKHNIETMLKWLRHGPSNAVVTDFEAKEVPIQSFAGFEIIR